MIAGSFGVSAALEQSGGAAAIGNAIVDIGRNAGGGTFTSEWAPPLAWPAQRWGHARAAPKRCPGNASPPLPHAVSAVYIATTLLSQVGKAAGARGRRRTGAAAGAGRLC